MASTGDRDDEAEFLAYSPPSEGESGSADDDGYDSHNEVLQDVPQEDGRTGKRDLEFGLDSEYFNYSDEDDDRENRFVGSSSTWRWFTEDERALAASLDQQRANDLGLHLYCAYNLKARARDAADVSGTLSSPSKKRKFREDEDDTVQWQPSREWTSWPLNPENVPRKPEQFGVPLPDSDDDAATYKKREDWRPSADIEEEIQALMKKGTKELLMRRGNGQALEEAELDFLADEERMETIMDSSVRRTVSKLNDVFMRLHKMKKSRSRSRSRPAAGRRTSQSGLAEDEPPAAPRRTGSGNGRSHLNDNHAENTDPDTDEEEDEDEAQFKSSSKRKRLPKPRDWNDILRIALVAGFDRKAVERTASRCAALFGEATKPLPMQWNCPVPRCDRNGVPFPRGQRWREHLKRTHGFNSEKIRVIEEGMVSGPGGMVVDGEAVERDEDDSVETENSETMDE